jgi:hypothetical protein
MAEDTERVVLLDNTRLFRVKTVLAKFEGMSAPVDFQNPLPVRADGRTLGWASIEVCPGIEDTIQADIVFSYETPERFSIETEAQKLYGHLVGILGFAEEPFEKVGALTDKLPAPTEIVALALEVSSEPAFKDQPHLGEVIPWPLF